MRLYNGDCLETMDKLIEEGVKVDAIITDPPYGTTKCKWDSIIDFNEMRNRLNKLIKLNGAIVLFAGEPFASMLRVSNIKKYKYDWIWNKIQGTGFLNSKKMPLKVFENICVFQDTVNYNPQMRTGFKPYIIKKGLGTENYNKDSKDNIITKSNGERFPINILTYSRDKDKLHPTQKPVELLEYLIKTYTNESEIVLDFTMGSGTTGVACKNLNRDFIGIELDEEYFNIAKNRIENN